MDVAYRTAQMSFAVRSKVGAVLVKDNHILATGWNGTPTGFDNTCEEKAKKQSYFDRLVNPTGLCTKSDVIHAESNVIYFCAKHGIQTDGTVLYITLSPCANCALAVIQAGIKKVYYHEKYRNDEGLKILDEAKVEVRQL